MPKLWHRVGQLGPSIHCAGHGGHKGVKKKKKKQKVRDAGFLRAGTTARDAVRIASVDDRRAQRSLKQRERRRRQRAHRRHAIVAASGPEEQSGQQHRRPSNLSRESRQKHQAARNRRRNQQRRLQRRLQQRRTTIATLVSSVTQQSETTDQEVQQLLTEQPASNWCAVHHTDEPVGSTRRPDDGILLVVTARVYGKECRALVDSGATRSFITPAAVLRCGLHTTHQETLLELADGRKLLSQGYCPHVVCNVSGKSCKVDFTVCPLMTKIDLILGMDWLRLTNPLIDWTTPRIVFVSDATTSAAVG